MSPASFSIGDGSSRRSQARPSTRGIRALGSLCHWCQTYRLRLGHPAHRLENVAHLPDGQDHDAPGLPRSARPGEARARADHHEVIEPRHPRQPPGAQRHLDGPGWRSLVLWTAPASTARDVGKHRHGGCSLQPRWTPAPATETVAGSAASSAAMPAASGSAACSCIRSARFSLVLGRMSGM